MQPLRYTGIASIHGEATTLCLAVDGSAVTLDLPGLMRFRLALERTGGNTYRLPAGAGPSLLEIEFSGAAASGFAHEGAERAAVTLAPEVPVDLAALSIHSGVYRTAGGRDLLAGTRGGDANPIPFLLDGDEVVRLHPTADASFVSERAELVRFDGDELVLERAGGPTAVAHRFEPYRSQHVTFPAEDAAIAGTLFVPQGQGPFPAIVLLHGSNPGERGFYQLYAHHFALQGIAALAYDRRGSGASTGSADSTLEQRARDAAAAIEFLRGRPGIDSERVGLWAFSNGTWSAPMIAARMTPVAFMVLTGAAGVSGADSETHRKLTELRGWGIGPTVLDEVQRAWRSAYACIAGGQWPDDVTPAEYDALIARLHDDPSLAAVPLAEYAVANPWLAPIPPNIPAAELQRNAGRVGDLAYDPAEDYARIGCPVLFLVGENDPNTPAAAAGRISDALARCGNRRSVVEVVPGAGHYINITPLEIAGMAAAEAASELHGLRFVPGYLERMASWVAQASRR